MYWLICRASVASGVDGGARIELEEDMTDENSDRPGLKELKEEADAVIEAAVQNGLVDPNVKLGDLIKLGKGGKSTTLGYVAAWDRYVAVVK